MNLEERMSIVFLAGPDRLGSSFVSIRRKCRNRCGVNKSFTARGHAIPVRVSALIRSLYTGTEFGCYLTHVVESNSPSPPSNPPGVRGPRRR